MSDQNQEAVAGLPREIVSVESLGGDVIVQGPLLSDLLANEMLQMREKKPIDGETDMEAAARAAATEAIRVLHKCVVTPEGKPLKTRHEWNVFGGRHPNDAARLFNIAQRLAGSDAEEVQKN